MADFFLSTYLYLLDLYSCSLGFTSLYITTQNYISLSIFYPSPSFIYLSISLCIYAYTYIYIYIYIYKYITLCLYLYLCIYLFNQIYKLKVIRLITTQSCRVFFFFFAIVKFVLRKQCVNSKCIQTKKSGFMITPSFQPCNLLPMSEKSIIVNILGAIDCECNTVICLGFDVNIF